MTTKAPAKLNIRLKITGRRPDGYHELVSIMVPVTLFDEIGISPGAEGIHLETEGVSVPADETNLVFRAAEAFLSRLGIRPGSVHPALQSGSQWQPDWGAAAATQRPPSRPSTGSSPTPCPTGSLPTMAVRLGADVPFFLNARPCLATSIGEILEPIHRWPPWWYVLVAPPSCRVHGMGLWPFQIKVDIPRQGIYTKHLEKRAF